MIRSLSRSVTELNRLKLKVLAKGATLIKIRKTHCSNTEWFLTKINSYKNSAMIWNKLHIKISSHLGNFY